MNACKKENELGQKVSNLGFREEGIKSRETDCRGSAVTHAH